MNQQIIANLLLCGFCLGFCTQFSPRKYFYINELLTWYEAQQYCREHYTDLATFESEDEINGLEAPFSYSWAWIGLWDDPNSWKSEMGSESNSWRWSATGETSKATYEKWATGNPDFYTAHETCVAMTYDGVWVDVNCWSRSAFICYSVTEQNVKEFVYISTPEIWSSARAYCREHYVDLAMIENEEENRKANEIRSELAWIGLYRVPWTWSDKSPSLFKHRIYSSPQNSGGIRHCALENSLHEWSVENCGFPNVFICHQVVKMTNIVRITTVTDADLTDPAINAEILQQLDALLTSQGWTDFKMQWKTLPKKEDKHECTGHQCN